VGVTIWNHYNMESLQYGSKEKELSHYLYNCILIENCKIYAFLYTYAFLYILLNSN